MKFISGVIAAVIAGLLLLLLTPPIQRWSQSGQRLVGLTDARALWVSPEMREDIARTKASNYYRRVVIRNIGREDLENFSVDVIGGEGGPILSAGDFTGLEGAEEPVTSLDEGRLKLKAKIFKENENFSFWVMTADSAPLTMRINQKGVDFRVSAADNDFISQSPEFTILIGILAILLGCIGGIIIADFHTTHVIRKVGFDPKEVLELYDKIKKDQR